MSKKVTEQDIEQARSINLITYIEGMGFKPSFRYGDKAMFLSPLRAENHPSFYVSHYNGHWVWKDWGTEEHGDIIEFIKIYHTVDFSEAVEILLGEDFQVSSPRIDVGCNKDKTNKIRWIRNIYKQSIAMLYNEDIERFKTYFVNKGVRYYPSIGCICYNSFRDKKSYIAIPIPFPEKIRGLECREYKDEGRKTLGCKTLWVLKRDTSRVLVTESILDALAGEIVLNDDTITLCSINGVGNIGKVEKLVKQYNPKEVFFALDNDEPGQKAQERGIEIVKPLSKVHIVNNHVKSGVKDLHKLLITKKGSVAVASAFMFATILYLLL